MATSPKLHYLKDLLITDEVRDQVAHRVSISKLLYYWEGRNAWHSTWSLSDHRAQAFSTDMQILRDRVEAERKQGSIFNIAEIPCLVIHGRTLAVLITDASPDFPLICHKQPVFKGTRVLALARELVLYRSNSTFAWWTKDPLESAGDNFYVYKSKSEGADYRLSWSKSESRCRTDFIHAFQSTLAQHIRGQA